MGHFSALGSFCRATVLDSNTLKVFDWEAQATDRDLAGDGYIPCSKHQRELHRRRRVSEKRDLMLLWRYKSQSQNDQFLLQPLDIRSPPVSATHAVSGHA